MISTNFLKQKIRNVVDSTVEAISIFRKLTNEIRDLKLGIAELALRQHNIENDIQTFWNDYAEFKAVMEDVEYISPEVEEDLH